MLIYAFFAQAMHQPLPLTCLPPKAAQFAQASVALPWYSMQLLQFFPAA